MITNLQNEQIKELVKLQLRKGRTEAGVFLIEGVRFVEEAFKAGIKPEQLVISPKLAETSRGQQLLTYCHQQGYPILEVEQRVLAKVADTEQPQGIVAVVTIPSYCWPDVLVEGTIPLFQRFTDELKVQIGKVMPCWLVVDGIQDPGNLGTIIRTAHGAGISGICLTPGTVDLFNPKVLRSTMGSIFHLPIIQGIAPEDIIAGAKSRAWQVVVGDLGAEREYYQVDLRKPTLLVVGSETQGPSQHFIDGATHKVKISMPGGAESLNVAVATGILLFEGIRQNKQA
ncbi:MAG: RNA methyltransferase [Carboxydocellales bacterium]